MPTSILAATQASPNSLDMAYAQSLRPCAYGEDTVLNPPRWSYQRRSVRSTWDKYPWVSLWPSSSFLCADTAVPMMDCAIPGGLRYAWGFPEILLSGNQAVKFLKGTCVDSVDAPVANAIVQGFVTSSDTFVGQVTAAADGTYILGTNNLASTQHYLVAYKAGAPDIAGTTVNTLLPTNIDGT